MSSQITSTATIALDPGTQFSYEISMDVLG